MHKYLEKIGTLLLMSTILSFGACSGEIDKAAQGLFILDNQSGHDVTLQVFKTQERQRAPLVIPLPDNTRVERMANGGIGGFAYPELFFQGDSVRLLFSDGKQLVHYCTQVQQLNGQCFPARNMLALENYQTEQIKEANYRYTFILTAADYALAR